MPRVSSAGWLGWSRVASRPSSPSVVRNAVTTRHFLATPIRSWLRISFDTAATISGVRPGARAARAAASAASESNQSRNSPTVSEDTGAKAARSWVSTMRRVTSSSS